jgi:NAD(P)-dependent dehydrogenase (short-subunit alcohol dehydrogenase family)
MMNQAARSFLVIGAGSAIGQALLAGLADQYPTAALQAVSRQTNPPASLAALDGLSWHGCDYSQDSMTGLVQGWQAHKAQFQKIFICNGILHDDSLTPEKKLEDFDPAAFTKVLSINTLLPMMWVKALLPLLRTSQQTVLTVFSARVGSISDNRLGGWYSYRASKAALNMLMQTASVEYHRRAPRVKLLCFHPGTIDTPLSKPFQNNLAAGQLQSPEFVAARLLSITDSLQADGKLAYMDWRGEPIPF